MPVVMYTNAEESENCEFIESTGHLNHVLFE